MHTYLDASSKKDTGANCSFPHLKDLGRLKNALAIENECMAFAEGRKVKSEKPPFT